MKLRQLKFLIIINILLLMSGCAAFLVGGSGAEGYYYGEKKEPETSAEKTRPDSNIASSIKKSFKKDNDLAKYYLYADVEQGVVTLYGTVVNQQLADKATALAQKANGVKSVTSKIKINQ